MGSPVGRGRRAPSKPLEWTVEGTDEANRTFRAAMWAYEAAKSRLLRVQERDDER